ncbi:MAG: hypothetical protein AB8G96_10970 [Phycisphaerales bacterium]
MTDAQRQPVRRLATTLLSVASMVCVVCVTGPLAGCQTPARRNLGAVRAYYDHDFPAARALLRPSAMESRGEDILLDNLRLGVASLADGDLAEAERSLGTSFDLLSTAGLNADRTTASVWVNEGVRIWKGEPFEQALGYYWTSVLYAVKGDWENARAAIVNASFRLADFGEGMSKEDLARRAADDDDYLDGGYTPVENELALARLLQGVATDLSGTNGASDSFDAAAAQLPRLAPVVETLRRRDYDTLLIVDYGKGPTKRAYGPDDSLAGFVAQDRGPAELRVRTGGMGGDGGSGNGSGSGGGSGSGSGSESDARFPSALNVNALAEDYRWNNLEDVRKAKSFFGRALTDVGAAVAFSRGSNNEERAAVGAGMVIAGLLLRSGAAADERHMEFAPQHVFIAPLRLGDRRTLDVSVETPDGTGSRIVLPDVMPGQANAPRTIYLRLLGPGSSAPEWLAATELRYWNDHAPGPAGSRPWILGGRDVGTPDRARLGRWREAGLPADVSLDDLAQLYRREEISVGSGADPRPGHRNDSFVHVLDGGRGLFTPEPHSIGYKRLMYRPGASAAPSDDRTRAIRDELTRP